MTDQRADKSNFQIEMSKETHSGRRFFFLYIIHQLESYVGWELDCTNIWASDRFQQNRVYNDHIHKNCTNTHTHSHRINAA